MSLTENTTSTEVAVVEEKPALNYDTHVLEKGQYWVSGLNLVGLVLDVNEHAVLFQVLMGLGKDNETPVFDFQAGQELFSHERFRKRLKEQMATLVKPDQNLLNKTLATYRELKNAGHIFVPKELPRTEVEGEEFIENEHYVVERVIIPPPKKVRDKKGFHWLKTGASGTFFTLKMWDPKIDNWVLPDGTVDTTARLGFVKGYYAEAMVLTDMSERETITQLSTRVIELLKSKGFFFDEKHITQEILSHSRFMKDEKESLFPVYQVAYLVTGSVDDTQQLTLVFQFDSKVVFNINFPDIQSLEFIPNKKSSLLLYT